MRLLGREKYLYDTDPEYREFIDRRERGEPPLPPSPIMRPCIHRGQPTGEKRTCKTCPGLVELKVFACAIHQQCTPYKSVEGIPDCHTCKDCR